jgi:hypothetical protein
MATASADQRLLSALWLMAALLAMSPAIAQTPPSGDFLEYLGSWEGGDEDWLAVAEWPADKALEDGESATPEKEVQDDEQEG